MNDTRKLAKHIQDALNVNSAYLMNDRWLGDRWLGVIEEAIEKNSTDPSILSALQQFTGFAHAKQGYDVESLAEAMGLTREEWNKIKDEVDASDADKEAIEEWLDQVDESLDDDHE
mgnify:CR=1 FL=1